MNEESQFLKHVGKAVCIFGSARENLPSKYYQIAEEIAAGAVDLGYATITGAGPGIMSSANKGCFENGGHSVGIRIQLPFEQSTNPFCTESHVFEKFYSRKCSLVRNSDVFIAMPGGFGTLDELFEVLTLVQCDKLRKPRTIILVGSEFWGGLIDWIREQMTEVTISKEDMFLFELLDDPQDVLDSL